MLKFLKTIIVSILTWEAACVLRKYKPFIIGVTGSVGKTTTKDAIYHVLKDSIASRKSQKSFNSELGIPLTILGLDNAWHNPIFWLWNITKGFLFVLLPLPYPKLLVLEIGADHPGDIKQVTKWIHPDVVVVTRLPDHPVHVEFFHSPDEVKKEKAELVRALKEHGAFIANVDDPAVVSLKELTAARMLTYGFGEEAQVRGGYVNVDYEEREGGKQPVGMIFRVDWQGNSVPVRLPGVLGMQPCVAALAALAVGIAYGESLLRMSEALATFTASPGRMRIIPGVNGSTIIDDSYNSSPVAAEAALETLKFVEGGRKIAMLGDMLELGQYEEEEHLRIGRIAASFADELIVVGKRAEWIAKAAKRAGHPEGRIHPFADSLEAGTRMRSFIKSHDVVLIKGSQGSGKNLIRMERAVKLLMAHPEDATRLLVRQESAWQ
jgi:UDP-N-acetylmuramoyl-tripeptide--D-alanyl-D-alanine ligase